jgi:hypothetical protein
MAAQNGRSARLVYRFRIELVEIEPLIWRQIEVPETYSLWDLHVAIQSAMGWHDAHLHLFEVSVQGTRSPRHIGIPVGEELVELPPVEPGWEVKIGEVFPRVGTEVPYTYDFGDNWVHCVTLEGILIREPRKHFPRCLDGARACPPEDCGGVFGYYDVLDIIASPQHPMYEETMDWLGGDFDPEGFSPRQVRFHNPRRRWRQAFGEG